MHQQWFLQSGGVSASLANKILDVAVNLHVFVQIFLARQFPVANTRIDSAVNIVGQTRIVNVGVYSQIYFSNVSTFWGFPVSSTPEQERKCATTFRRCLYSLLHLARAILNSIQRKYTSNCSSMQINTSLLLQKISSQHIFTRTRSHGKSYPLLNEKYIQLFINTG